MSTTVDDETQSHNTSHLTGVTQPPRHKRRTYIAIALALLIALIVIAVIRAHTPTEQPFGRRGAGAMGRPMPVSIAQVQRADLPIYLDALGTVTPQNVVTVRSRVNGQLDKISFREGQLVKQGDLLAVIDPRPFQVALDQAQGQLQRDQAQLDNARHDLERYQTLLKQDSIAKQQLDSQASLVRQYEGVIAVDRGQVADAKLNLEYTQIRAPLTGRLGLRQVDPGNLISTSDANGIAVITQMQPITVVFSIPEDQLPKVTEQLRKGAQLPATVLDRAGQKELASGMLLTLDNQIDPTTGTIKLKAQFANEQESLFPNQFVNVRLLVNTQRDAILVPAVAVQQGTSGPFVYLVNEDNTVSIRAVKVGVTDATHTAILQGLKPGDRVVTDGVDKLRDGATVMAIQPGATAAAPNSQRPHRRKPGQRRPESAG